MPLSRRKFNRLALWGTASFSATTSFYFPKPVQSYDLPEFQLNEATSRKVFGNLLRNASARRIGSTLPPQLNSQTAAQITVVERDFVRREFTLDKTDYARSNSNRNAGILWGQQKQEILVGTKADIIVPNAGFAIVQRDRGEITTAKFSGSTTVGLDSAIQVLASERIAPDAINASLIPWRSHFDDLGTWQGDLLLRRRTSLTSYRTRRGEVFYRYELIEPGAGGFGRLQITMEAEDEPRRDISIEIRFPQS